MTSMEIAYRKIFSAAYCNSMMVLASAMRRGDHGKGLIDRQFQHLDVFALVRDAAAPLTRMPGSYSARRNAVFR